MDKQKREKLEARGWKVGTVADFLNLSPEESAIIELRLVLSNALKAQRLACKMTQKDFAKTLRSSQSRIAKMEAGDPSVSFDLLIRNLLQTGIDRKKLSEIIAA
jgi:DNA-binding XRE family transcriptional regulator